MTTRVRPPHHRRTLYCPVCRATIAYVRPEWLVLRRFLPTIAAQKTERVGDELHITCQCGHLNRIKWAAIQF